MKLGDEGLVPLRALSRIRDALIAQANVLSNRIEAELLRFYPEISRLGSVQRDTWLLDLLELALTPGARAVRPPQIRMLLKKHRIRKHSVDEVLAPLREPSLRVAPRVAQACAHHIAMLIPRLRLVREQQRQCETDIERLLSKLSEPDPDLGAQRDAAIVQSLPEVGSRQRHSACGGMATPRRSTMIVFAFCQALLRSLSAAARQRLWECAEHAIRA